MNPRLHHCLITRFNLTFSTYSIDLHQWTDKRWSLFEQFCLPSILNQSTKNFKWLIYFDETTSENIRSKIRTILEEYSFIHCIFCNGHEEFLSKLPTDIVELTGIARGDLLLTTRIDNDDCFRTETFRVLQDHSLKLKNDAPINLLKTGFKRQTCFI